MAFPAWAARPTLMGSAAGLLSTLFSAAYSMLEGIRIRLDRQS